MKGSLITSSVVHATALAMTLVTLSAPAPMQVADVEALPVDIVPISELTKIQQGDKKAPLKEKAAPAPTKKPTIVPDAENAGDNDIDMKTPPTPAKKPVQQEVAAAPEKVDKVQPNQDTKTNDVNEIAKEETAAIPSKDDVPVPKNVPTPIAEPKPEPKPDPKPQETAKLEETPLPSAVPLPAVRPKPEPPKAETPKQAEVKPPTPKPEETKAPDVKKADKNQQMAKSKTSKESDFNADEIAALLNKTDAAGGGAKRSTQMASLGGKKTTSGESLSQSEIDALRGAIAQNWSVLNGMSDAKDVRIRAHFKLDESGNLIGEPDVTATGGTPSAQQVLISSARRAILKTAPFTNLPADKYDSWSEVVVNFDPSEFM